MNKKSIWNLYIAIKFIGDILLSLLSFFLAYYLRFYNKIFISIIPPIKGIPEFKSYYEFIPFFILICVISYLQGGYYKNQVLNIYDEVVNTLKVSIVVLFVLFAVGFFYRSYTYSRIFFIIFSILNFFTITLWHNILNFLYKKYTKYIFGKIKIGIICSQEKKNRIIKILKKDKNTKKFFLTNFNTEEDILSFIELRKVTDIIVEHKLFETEVFQKALPEIIYSSISVKVLVTLPVKLSEVLIDSTLGIPVISLQPLSLTGFNFFIKRSIDIFFSIFVLSILFAPLLFVAILIKIDSQGPIFFVHNRVGANGKVFKCLKFRTMFKDAHKMWWNLLKKSDRNGKVLKLRNDPRVTSIGRFLRKYSIDEVPQFFNVLKGDMSIVGPRPQIEEEVSFYNEHSKKRLMILPGITGLWQISGRADVSFEDMINLDLYYIENWSLGLDIEIMLKTLFVILSKKGAY